MEYLMRTPNGEFRHGYSLFAGKGKELRGFSNMSPLLLLPFYFTPVFTPEQLGDIHQVIDIYENNQDEIQDGEMIDEGQYYLLYSTVDRLDDLAFSFLDSYLVNGRSVGIDISAYIARMQSQLTKEQVLSSGALLATSFLAGGVAFLAFGYSRYKSKRQPSSGK